MIYISIVVQLSRKIIKHFYNEPVYVADGGETMAYSELIKNFNKIRDYMRDFYVYGFKSRDDYTKKSARSYDDEKRRIESWLGEYMKFHQTADGKNVFLSIDSRVTRHNPLYKAWKTKSFTDGDITLHFIIMDILSDGQERSLVAIVSQVDQYLSAFDHARVFDVSTIRKKLNEYVKEGLLVSRKNGKMMLYRRTEEIAEKPSVAQSIAAVLGATQRKDGYLEGNDYLVSWCVGHLVELAQPESYEEAWKKWSYESLPIIPQEWQHEVKSDTKAQYQILKKLMHDDRVDAVVCATDAGREGELIFRLTYNMAGCRKPMKRLWISSMEESAIRDGFHNLRPGSDYDNLYHSALCRQEADWLVGINGTRLFTVLYGGKALKVGRVQTPTLAMLVDRESKIMNFKKEAYYMAHIMGNGLDAVSEHISDKTEAERIAGACENGQALVTSVVKEEKWVAPPKLYDLTTLQRDANRLFGFTAKQTLEYTQSLYEKKLVTYPRTDSQYLSDDMEGTAKNVIEAIFNSLLFEQNIMFNPDIKRILNSKKVTDHHAIIPTMEIIKQDLRAIPESEMKILSLCANRLLCATGEKHIYNSTKAEITCNNIVFKVSGKEVWKNGWKEFEDFFKNSYKTTEDKSDTEEEKKLPELREGMMIAVEQTKVSEHFTQPPKHYTEDSLLSAMERAGSEDMDDDVERKGLGTPATRADIIEKLVKDGFVKREKKQMIPTEDGMKLITVLPDVVKSPKLTADWENELTQVSKGEVSAGQFISGIKAMVSDLVKTYHSISDEQKNMFGAGNTQEVFGTCPKCGGDVVKGKFGAYCKNKCGMNVNRALGIQLSDAQVKNLLAGKKILVKGLKGKKGNYDAYLIPESIEDFSYTKNGKEIKGSQYKFKMEFPHRKGKQG